MSDKTPLSLPGTLASAPPGRVAGFVTQWLVMGIVGLAGQRHLCVLEAWTQVDLPVKAPDRGGGRSARA